MKRKKAKMMSKRKQQCGIAPKLSGGKVFYEVYRIDRRGMYHFRKTLDYFETKEKAKAFIESQDDER